MADIRIFNPEGLAKPAGTYTHIAHAKTQEIVFIAGQVPVDASGAVVGKGDIEAQSAQSLCQYSHRPACGRRRLEERRAIHEFFGPAAGRGRHFGHTVAGNFPGCFRAACVHRALYSSSAAWPMRIICSKCRRSRRSNRLRGSVRARQRPPTGHALPWRDERRKCAQIPPALSPSLFAQPRTEPSLTASAAIPCGGGRFSWDRSQQGHRAATAGYSGPRSCDP